MDLALIAAFALFIKIPMVVCCWYIYRAIHDVPEVEIEDDGGEFDRRLYEPGPRNRGPHGTGPGKSRRIRRGDKGHDETAPTVRPGTRVGAE